MSLQDSGDRREFDTGAVRDMGEGKGRFDLLPFWSLFELAKHYEAGAKKYDDNNWRKGIPLKVFFDSAMRHMAKMAMGYTDERHDLAALWNIACFIETKQRIGLGQLPDALLDFPHVDMRPIVKMHEPVRVNPTDLARQDWTPPTNEEQQAYIASLNKLNVEAGVPFTDVEDDWAPENCSKPFDIDGKLAMVGLPLGNPPPLPQGWPSPDDFTIPVGFPYAPGGPSLGPCGRGSCGKFGPDGCESGEGYCGKA